MMSFLRNKFLFENINRLKLILSIILWKKIKPFSYLLNDVKIRFISQISLQKTNFN